MRKREGREGEGGKGQMRGHKERESGEGLWGERGNM